MGLAIALLPGATWAADGATVVSQPDIKWAPCGKDPPWNVCERAVLHGDPAKETSENMVRFPKGFAFPKHWHVNAEQVVITAGYMVITFEGGREQTVRAGGFMYIPPKLAHWGNCPEGCTIYLGIVGPDSYFE
jgi:quercetin dioxygenase-like cupin family protein